MSNVLAPQFQDHDDTCPWCAQPVPNGTFRELAARHQKREQDRQSALQREIEGRFARDQAATIARVREEVRQAAEAELAKRYAEAQAQSTARLGDLEARLNAATAAKAAAEAAASEQKTIVEALLSDQRDALEREKIAAVSIEQAKAFDQNQKFQKQVLDLQRQLENKTAQEIGEGAEIDLFEKLKAEFEEDRLRRVEKGAAGVDIVHDIYHNGKLCGRVVYDSKKHSAWRNDFVTKLRNDQAEANADHAILSAHVFPAGARQLHLQEGVIVTNPARVVAIVQLLRRHVVQTYALRLSNEARTNKTAALYEFIMSERCANLLHTIESQAGHLTEMDVRERKAHEKVWKDRATLIRTVQRAHGDLTGEIERIIGTGAALPNTTDSAPDNETGDF